MYTQSDEEAKANQTHEKTQTQIYVVHPLLGLRPPIRSISIKPFNQGYITAVVTLHPFHNISYRDQH